MLAFDGSASGDCTALVGCTLDGHIWIEGLWENPGDLRWRVPREEVTNAVDIAMQTLPRCSSWRAIRGGGGRRSRQWASRHGERRVVEWNTAHAQRMAPATDRLYQAVVTRSRYP